MACLGKIEGDKCMKYGWLDEYLLAKKGVRKDFKAEWNWLRYMVGDKMFAAVCYDDNNNQPTQRRPICLFWYSLQITMAISPLSRKETSPTSTSLYSI